jgi:hypothetical protein
MGQKPMEPLASTEPGPGIKNEDVASLEYG